MATRKTTTNTLNKSKEERLKVKEASAAKTTNTKTVKKSTSSTTTAKTTSSNKNTNSSEKKTSSTKTTTSKQTSKLQENIDKRSGNKTTPTKTKDVAKNVANIINKKTEKPKTTVPQYDVYEKVNNILESGRNRKTETNALDLGRQGTQRTKEEPGDQKLMKMAGNIVGGLVGAGLKGYDIGKEFINSIAVNQIEHNRDNYLKMGMTDEEIDEWIRNKNDAFDINDENNWSNLIDKQIEKNRETIYKDTNAVEQFALQTVESAGQFGAHMLLAMATGGSSLVTMGLQAGTEKAYQNIQEGYDTQTAIGNGVMTGIMTALVEKLPVDNFGKLVSSPLSQFSLAAIASQAINEGAEEGLEYLIEPQIDRLMLGKEVEYNAGDLFMSIALGMSSGGLIGTVGNAIPIINTKIETRKQFNQLKADMETLIEYKNTNQLTEEETVAIESALTLAQKALNKFESTSVLKNAVQYESDKVNKLSAREIQENFTKFLQPQIDQDAKLNQEQQAVNSILETSQNVLAQKGIQMDALQYSKLDNEVKTEVDKIQSFANSLNTNVVFNSELVTEGGQVIDGMYIPEVGIVINPKGKRKAMSTFVHELTHGTESSQYYAPLKKLLIDNNNNYMSEVMKIQKAYKTVADLSLEDATKEFVAIETQNKLGNEQFVEGLVKYNTSLANRIYEGVINMLSITDTEQEVAYNFKKAFKNTGINPTLNPQFSIATYEDGGRDYLKNWLDNSDDVSKKDKQDILKHIDEAYRMVKELSSKDEYSNFTSWSQTKLKFRPDGTPMLSVVVPNGDYPLNIDFSQVCKKRKTLNTVLNELVRSGDLDNRILGITDIGEINRIIKANDFEIACGLCFVDSKRYRQGLWAESFTDTYNYLVKSLIPVGSEIEVDEYNFTNREITNPKENLLKNVDDSKLDFTYINEVLDKYNSGKAIYRYAKAIKENPELRSILNPSEIMASEGLDNLRLENPKLFELVNSHQGSAKPKLSHGEVPYGNDILLDNRFTKENAYAVGGVRVQSFSDYMANMFFDYVQMITELQAKGLPAHAYTKEPSFARIFGLTGMKINLSIVPKAANLTNEQKQRFNSMTKAQRSKDPEFRKLKERAGLDENGNYIVEDETFPLGEALEIQNSEGYDKNVGIIWVGVSDAHIEKMLDDDNVPFIIPYHKSSLNPAIARMRNIDLYNDYTKQQNTRYNTKAKKKVPANIWSFDFYIDLAKTNDPKQTARNYVEECEKRGYLPKFDKWKDHPNYYKLLVDFRVYDKNGNYCPQTSVNLTFPENLRDLVEDSLKESEKDSFKTDRRIPQVLNQIRSKLGLGNKKYITTSDGLVYEVYEGDDKPKNVFNLNTVTQIDESELEKATKDLENIKINSNQGFAKQIKKYLKSNFSYQNKTPIKVKSVKNSDNSDYYVDIFKSINGKLSSMFFDNYKYSKEILVAFNHLDELLGNATYLISGSFDAHAVSNPDDRGVKRYDYLSSIMKIGDNGEELTVYFDVEIANVNRVRSYSIKKISLKDPLGGLVKLESLGSSSNNIISDDQQSVKYSIGFDSQGRTLSKEQQEYFKDSKVRDKNGNLMTVYHGTPNGEFTVFDADRIGETTDEGDWGTGFYFTDVKDGAQSYANGDNAKVYETYLNLTNPLRIDKYEEYQRLYPKLRNHEEILRQIGLTDEEYESLVEAVESLEDNWQGYTIEYLGYDGVIQGNDNGHIYVATNPNQIKNVTNNKPTTDKDIRYSIGLDQEDLNKGLEAHDQALDQYGAFDKGEIPVRDVKIAQETDYGKTNRFTRTIAESASVSDEQVDLLKAKIGSGEFAYQPISNDQLQKDAQMKIEKLGDEKAIQDFLESDGYSSATIAQGELLLDKVARSSENELAMRIASKLAMQLTEAGRAVQSARLLKRLTPQGQLVYVERTISKLQKSIDTRYGKKAPQLEMTDELKSKLLNAQNETEMNQVLEEISVSLAKQMPSTLMDKLNAWRYLAMLGNPRTHVRNLVGNAMFYPMVSIKNGVATVIESVVQKNGKLETRTKSFVNKSNEQDKLLLDFANNNFEECKKLFEKNGKYDIKELIEANRDVWDNNTTHGKVLNKLVKANSGALEWGDVIFSKARYRSSLAQYMKANGLTPNDVDSKEFLKAQEYAYKEACKQTYRDQNAFADAIGKFAKTNRATQLAVDAIVPFKKTPMNVLARGMEYSPLGLIWNVTKGSMDLKNGKITANEFIDKLSAGLTGTGVTLLGAFLAGIGAFRTRDEDKDRKQMYDEDLGEQDYALVFPHGTYTIDWASPLIMPLAIGAELYDGIDSFENVDELITVASKITEPIFETSMLSGLTSTLQSYASGSAGAFNMIQNAISSYFNQYVPTLFGQIARSIDDTRRTTYPNDGVIDKTGKQILNKIPGLTYMNEPYINRKGEQQKQEGNNILTRMMLNMLSPGYYKSNTMDEYDEELMRLYNIGNNTDALPSSSSKSITYENNKYDLKDEAYTNFHETRYSIEKESVNEFIDSLEYDTLEDETKISIIGKIREYAGQEAKAQYLETIGIDFEDASYEKVKGALDSGVSLHEYFLSREVLNNIDSEDKKGAYIDYLNNSGMDAKSINYLYDMEYANSNLTVRINDLAKGAKLDADQTFKIKEILSTTDSVKDSNGKTITNSRALSVRKQLDELGLYDDVVKFVQENKLQNKDMNLTNDVVAMSNSEFQSKYKEIYGESYKAQTDDSLYNAYASTFGASSGSKKGSSKNTSNIINGINFSEIKNYKDSLTGKNNAKDEFINYIAGTNYSGAQKNQIFEKYYGDNKLNNYLDDFSTSVGNDDENKFNVKAMVNTVQGLKDADGDTIRNSKAIELRGMLEEQGIYDEYVKYINDNNLNYSFMGLNESVVEMSKNEFVSAHNKMYGTSLEYDKQELEQSFNFDKGKVDNIIAKIYGNKSTSSNSYNTIDNILSKVKTSKKAPSNNIKSKYSKLIKDYLKNHPEDAHLFS